MILPLTRHHRRNHRDLYERGMRFYAVVKGGYIVASRTEEGCQRLLDEAKARALQDERFAKRAGKRMTSMVRTL